MQFFQPKRGSEFVQRSTNDGKVMGKEGVVWAWVRLRKCRLEGQDQDQLPADVDLDVRVQTVFGSDEVALPALLGTSIETPRW